MWMVWAWQEIHKVLFKPWKKKRGVQNRIRKLIVEEKDNWSQRNIQQHKAFYEILFKQNFSKTNVEKQRFLNSVSTKKLTNEQYDLCENKVSNWSIRFHKKYEDNN